jgi:hypothetical protein
MKWSILGLRVRTVENRVSLVGALVAALGLLMVAGIASFQILNNAKENAFASVLAQVTQIERVAESLDHMAFQNAEARFRGFKSSLRGAFFSQDPKTKALHYGVESMRFRVAEVDAFTESAGGYASVFVLKNNAFVCETTSEKMASGERAVAYSLDSRSAMFANLIKGKPYSGYHFGFGGALYLICGAYYRRVRWRHRCDGRPHRGW